MENRKMMQAEIVQPQIYFCRTCDKERQTINPECLQCGKTMQTQSQIKSLGKLLVILGIVITLLCGLGFLLALAILLFAKNPPKEVAADAFAALLGCGGFLVFGVTTIIRGARQAKYDRISKISA